MKLYKANRLMMVCLMATGLCFSFAQVANANDPHAGKYELVVPEQPTTTPDKVEVVELFWYTCPHCKIFEEKFFKQWRAEKPEDVEVIHMPAVFNRPGKPDQRIPLAKAFYIAKALGVFDKIHQPLFYAVHTQKRKMNNEEALQQFFAQYGVSKEDFTNTYHSFGIDAKIKRASEMTDRYGITGVPVVIVNGKYRLNSTKADGYKKMMKILDDLIEQERQKLPKKAENAD